MREKNLEDLLAAVREAKASDLHIIPGVSPLARIDGNLVPLMDQKLDSGDTEHLCRQALSEEKFNLLSQSNKEIDVALTFDQQSRFRINAHKQRGLYSMAIRSLMNKIPTIEELGLPSVLVDLTRKRRGLILVTGPTGSGKSTTLASMIHEINLRDSKHIITIEDPIEYVHEHHKSIITQRELGPDTESFSQALRAALRQDPDIIFVGEMRDQETISTALTAAETGHLVLSTLHTNGAVETINRIVDSFPAHQQQQIRMQLSANLKGIISQQLLPLKSSSGRIAAQEIMIVTPAIKNLIREGKNHQITSLIMTGARHGMQTMDKTLIGMYNQGIISRDDLSQYAYDDEEIQRNFDTGL